MYAITTALAQERIRDMQHQACLNRLSRMARAARRQRRAAAHR